CREPPETSSRRSTSGTLREKMPTAISDAISSPRPEQHARGLVRAHASHSYPAGASLYFTSISPRQLDREVEQWLAIKRAASDAILMNGGTISHHHGVGTDHAPWLPEEKGEIGMSLLKATKRELDPKGVMNPGKLFG